MLAQRTRPVGITIISVIQAIQGVLGIITGILELTAGGSTSGAMAGAVTFIGVLTLILSVLLLVLAWGLWTLRTWAFWTTVVIEVLSLIGGIFSWTQGHSTALGIVLNVVVPVVILLYMFLDRNVRAAFRT